MIVMPDFFYIFAIRNGGLAQLARAFAWHARGHRFDSDILHIGNKALQFFAKPFFFLINFVIKRKVITRLMRL